MKRAFTTLAGLIFLIACNPDHKTPFKTSEDGVQEDIGNHDYSLIGRKGRLVYPEFSAEVSYLTDSTLHWRTTYSEGEIFEGNEKVFLKKLDDHQYFLNWIEKDGVSISQVINLKTKIVTAYGTFADEKSPRGKRSSMSLEGTFEFVK